MSALPESRSRWKFKRTLDLKAKLQRLRDGKNDDDAKLLMIHQLWLWKLHESMSLELLVVFSCSGVCSGPYTVLTIAQYRHRHHCLSREVAHRVQSQSARRPATKSPIRQQFISSARATHRAYCLRMCQIHSRIQPCRLGAAYP